MKLLRIPTLLISMLLVSAGASATEEKTLYEEWGGIYPIAHVVDEYIELVAGHKDFQNQPLVQNPRAKSGFRYRLTSLVAQAMGGPEVYTGHMTSEKVEDVFKNNPQQAETLTKLFKATMAINDIKPEDQQKLVDVLKGAGFFGGAQ